MTIQKNVVTWTGFPGAPGYSVFYALPGGGFVDALHTFFQTLNGAFPANVRIQVAGSGLEINQATGVITGTWSGTTPALVTCTGGGNYAAPVGTSVNWLTSTVVGGKFVRGRTFLVPMASAVFDTDGSISATALSQIQTAAAALVTAGTDYFVAWHRPVAGSGGVAANITGSLVRDRASVLTSRRPS